MLAFSDWTAASIQNSPKRNFCIEAVKKRLLSLFGYYLKLKRINWRLNGKSAGSPNCFGRARQILFRSQPLWDFIFNEQKKKSDLANDLDAAKWIYSARGEWVLQNSDWTALNSKLMRYIVDVDHDQSLLLWHIAKYRSLLSYEGQLE
ncbi:hypothetical protein FH972_000310 [Carpinus fangiana]|uniref:Uncharacterized protein n=1 Tax=Carpinus fangiana TaxID=176857 RepID=A0A5N6Q8R1_9ROSI|nr:hypothetical protein FH972_000310 [Carpinus fangiana]